MLTILEINLQITRERIAIMTIYIELLYLIIDERRKYKSRGRANLYDS